MTRLRPLALCCAVMLVLVACGRDEDGAADDGDEPPTTDVPSGGDGEFADLGVVCSPAEGDGPEPVEGEFGIDGTTISVGTMADPGFPARLGLNQEIFDTAEAFVEWCNDAGGIRGYTLDLTLRDARLTEVANRMLEACDEDFALVGGGTVFDNQGQEPRLDCRNGSIPDFPGFVVTPQAADADLVVQPIPNPVQTLPFGDFAWLGEQYPDSTQNVGVLTGNLETTQIQARKYEEAITDQGWNVVYSDIYNSGGEQAATWRGFVQAMQSRGVQGLIWVGEPENLAEIQAEMSNAQYRPEWIRTDANHYDTRYIELGGSDVENTFVRSAFWPFERADENPATQQYLDLIDSVDGKVALLGVQALSAWLLFATAVGDCVDDGDLTRDCVYETALAHTDWTGGGLHARHDLAARAGSDCFLVLEATADGYVEADIEPNEGIYNCGDENIVELDGDYGTGARCPSGADDPIPSTCREG